MKGRRQAVFGLSGRPSPENNLSRLIVQENRGVGMSTVLPPRPCLSLFGLYAPGWHDFWCDIQGCTELLGKDELLRIY